MKRRTFIKSAAGITIASAVKQSIGQATRPLAHDQVTVCVMGVRGRGSGLLNTFASLPEVNVKYVCDLDLGVLKSRVAEVKSKTGTTPLAITDYRRALDDESIDALVSGTPDHWHALPTIHACQAGKDVYVEKPDGHNITEGRTMVAAAKKYKRIVQLGTQARSGQMQQEAMRYIRAGNLGKVRFAKAWESARQGSIGYPADSEPPTGFDYNTWLGPAPKRPFNTRRWHGSWRWFFDYGSGDLGNDGVHRLDIARWGLENAIASENGSPLGLPDSVSAHGGKLYFDDAQEWPDTLMVTYDYSGHLLTYEMRIWSPYRLHDEAEGAAVYGDEGYVVIGNERWRAFDRKGKEIHASGGSSNSLNTLAHARNFLQCIRTREKPNADLESVGHPTSLLCHLGNAAWRASRTLRYNPHTNRFQNDDQANQFLTRPQYRKPWVLPDIAQL